MGGPVVVAFLSTGRCGTQWLTSGLRELHLQLGQVRPRQGRPVQELLVPAGSKGSTADELSERLRGGAV